MKKRLILFAAILGIVFAVDLCSKYWTAALTMDSMHVFSWGAIDLFLTPTLNRGAAWGMFASFTTQLLIFRIAVMSYLAYIFLKSDSRMQEVALALIFSGAFCNVFDILYRGHVVDMIHFLFWSRSYGVFNIADAAIFSGAALLFIYLSIKKRHAKHASDS
ncbi:MAG: signal peptidase II [Chlamydiae bacterium RIFCSPHIGHO2_12_FULL_49_11]|nr:MAG: signal peptidase II [Chlamydiae bacterium RIFCSPHIGHO2_12_FULL_49_11]